MSVTFHVPSLTENLRGQDILSPVKSSTAYVARLYKGKAVSRHGTTLLFRV